MLKEMIYKNERIKPERIADGEYKGLKYYVLSMGTHPCAYVEVTNTCLDGVEYDYLYNIDCHGGLTYSRDCLATVENKGWFIGWDYGHYGDYVGGSYFSFDEKEWHTTEMVLECKEVIDQVIEMTEGKRPLLTKSYFEKSKDEDSDNIKEESPIYVIALFSDYKVSPLGLMTLEDKFLVGYRHTFESAERTVTENMCDLYEDCYNYALIEEVEPYLYPYDSKRYLYKYDKTTNKYNLIEKPLEFKRITNLTIGG